MIKKNVILIVDQNLNRRNNLSTRFRMMGYTSEMVSSGMQAINYLEDSKENNNKVYRLVLIVGDSEDMPGKEVMLIMREIEKNKNRLPILIVNQDADPDNILETIQLGANDYLVDLQNEGKIVRKVQKIAPPLEK